MTVSWLDFIGFPRFNGTPIGGQRLQVPYLEDEFIIRISWNSSYLGVHQGRLLKVVTHLQRSCFLWKNQFSLNNSPNHKFHRIMRAAGDCGHLFRATHVVDMRYQVSEHLQLRDVAKPITIWGCTSYINLPPIYSDIGDGSSTIVANLPRRDSPTSRTFQLTRGNNPNHWGYLMLFAGKASGQESAFCIGCRATFYHILSTSPR